MIDCKILIAIKDLYLVQINVTLKSIKYLSTLLDYSYANPDAKITYRKSDMIIKVHSYGSYISVTQSRSRASGRFYCRDNMPLTVENYNQGSKFQEFSVITPVVATATECETATLTLNGQIKILIRISEKELGHKKPAAPMRVDNTTTCNCAHDNLQ